MRYQLKIDFKTLIWKFILRLTQIPIEIIICKFFEMVVRSFWFGVNTFSPLALIAKNGELESPLATFLPLWRLIPSPK